MKYMELFEILESKINSGELKNGEKLPSKRNMALDYNVSLNTVMSAYNLLLDEGYIYSVEKKGYYVSNQLLVNKKPMVEEIQRENKKAIRFDFTTQSIEDFPTTNWKKLFKQELSNKEYLNKTEFMGDFFLRQAIAAHLKVNRGILANPENIVISGGIEVLERILRISNIKTLSLENPGYHKLARIATNNGLDVRYLPLDNEGVTLPKEKTILYTTPFNQFPTGIKMTISRKKELIQFAEATNSFLIEDDFDAEFRIHATKTTSLYSLNPNHVIFFSTFGETIYPGIRISYFILPSTLVHLYKECYKDYSCLTPTLEQRVLASFIKEGYYESHINRLKKRFLEKRSILLEELQKHSIFSCDAKKNYLSIPVTINTRKTDEEIKRILSEQGIQINLISDYDIEKKDSHTLVLGYTAIPLEDTKKGIQSLIEILEK